ncbi:MAG: hypothetical protein QXL17_06460 [Candidatus Thermoplasmatota archaeon]
MNDPKIKLTNQRHEILTFLKYTITHQTVYDVYAAVKKLKEMNIDVAHTNFFSICKKCVNGQNQKKQGAINV